MPNCLQRAVASVPGNQPIGMRRRVLPARLRRAGFWALAWLLAAALGHPLFGQLLYGTLTGTVTDKTGAMVPGAKVTAVETSTGVSHESQANAEGIYIFSNLNPGTYQVTIAAGGFNSKQENGISLLSNTTDRVDMQLDPGSVSQNVEVTTAPALLQTDRAETNYNISPQQVSELPTTSTTGRNFEGLFELVPGSTPPAEQNTAALNPQRAEAVNVNGVSSETNTTRIDGAIDAYPWRPSLAAYLPPTDGIGSINIVTGSFNAEQGTAGGSAINVTIKSGTNAIHGSLWEYNSVAQFNAQPWQNRTGMRQKNTYNEAGGSIGGPIEKNKLFYFADFDRVSVYQALTGLLSVPTLAMRQGNFNGTGVTVYDPVTGSATGAGKTAFAQDMIPSTRFDSAALILLANEPLPNTGAAGATINNFFGATHNTFVRMNADGKITWVPTQNTSLFGHYSASPNTIFDPQAFGPNPGGPTYDTGTPGGSSGLVQNIGVGVTHSFSPNFLIDGNFGYTTQSLTTQNTDIALGDYGANVLNIPGTNLSGNPLYAGIPAMNLTTYANLGNNVTASPFSFNDNQYTGNLNGTYTHKTHTIRFGGEYLHANLSHVQPGSATFGDSRGLFAFSGGVSAPSGGTLSPVNSFADFLLGQASSYYKGLEGLGPLTLSSSNFGYFAQDTWEASNRLTLSYGARYEYYPLPIQFGTGTVRYDPSVPTTVTDTFGTHTVGTVLVGGMGGTPQHANTRNGWGMIVPRLGVSYRVNDKTVVRAGFGMTVDPDNIHNLLQDYPQALAISVSGTNTAVAATSLNTGLKSTVAQVGIPAISAPNISSGSVPLPETVQSYTIPQNFRRGYIYSDNLSIQRELPAKFTSTIAYVGTHAVRQQTAINMNPAPPGGGTAGRNLNTLYGVNTSNTDITEELPFQGTTYNGLQTQLTRTTPNRGSTGIIYTFSKAMDASDNGETGGLVFNYPTYWSRNYALSGYDRKHNLQWWTAVQSPFGAGQPFLQHGVGGYILGNWRLSTILSRVSGSPFSVTASTGLLNAPGNTQVADRNYAVNPILNQNVNGNRQYLNAAAFSDVSTAAGVTVPRFGTSGRDSVRGPGIFNLNVSLKRQFPVWDNWKVEFAAEAFDVTNTPQFANPAAAINTVTTTAGVVNLGGFGTLTTSNVNRTMRLSARITF